MQKFAAFKSNEQQPLFPPPKKPQHCNKISLYRLHEHGLLILIAQYVLHEFTAKASSDCPVLQPIVPYRSF
ncbi:hypothetical protein [Bartonella sp. AA126HLJHH]|uniref:hypothetical protein n=1 Tax=Bartonella sp. AA126HLJHH TaxID=3243426 RepID=UPI0035D1246B